MTSCLVSNQSKSSWLVIPLLHFHVVHVVSYLLLFERDTVSIATSCPAMEHNHRDSSEALSKHMHNICRTIGWIVINLQRRKSIGRLAPSLRFQDQPLGLELVFLKDANGLVISLVIGQLTLPSQNCQPTSMVFHCPFPSYAFA